ncbi:hypothetical protein MPSEU_000367600 [Mayamaea pseudoterrestris]|nr:hypothetical protein MPSEU_000367600 [Mayamaea pseudoterrestris]
MSQDHPLHQPGDNASLSGSLDLNHSNTMAILKAVQQQQGQDVQGLNFGGGSNTTFGFPSQQQMNSMFGNGIGGNDQSQQQQLQQQPPDFQLELKRLNDQLNNASGPPSNALLLTGNNSQQSSNGGSGNLSATALFQSLMLEQQRAMGMPQQQQHAPQSPRPQHSVSGSNLSTNNTMQPGFFQDPRVMIAQNQLASFQRQLDVPLPSPHSLFHRDGSRRMRGGVIEPFPEKLMRLLNECEAAGRTDVVSWIANGRAFAIHKPDKFFKEIVPLYFRQSRLSSFKRQLNLYNYELINSGPARGGYFNELFVRDHPELCRRMRRVAVKVGGHKERDGGARVDHREQPHQSQAPVGRKSSSKTVSVEGTIFDLSEDTGNDNA